MSREKPINYFKGGKNYSRAQIEEAISKTQSSGQAARFLGCDYRIFRKFAKVYGLFTENINRGGLGIKRWQADNIDNFDVSKIIHGEIDPSHFDPYKLKYRMITAGYLKESCYICGFNEKRIIDDKSPLLLYFLDGNKRNWGGNNAQLLCYNHYFTHVGNVFNQKDLATIETNEGFHNKTKAVDMELDKYTMERLKELGLG